MLVPCSTVLEFNTDICKSSLPWVIILLFRLIFMCVSVSSHLCLVNMLFLIVLYILFFFRPTNLSISSPHRGAETKLNCLLLFTTFLIYLTADTKVCTILLFVCRRWQAPWRSSCFSWSSSPRNEKLQRPVA